MQGRGALRRELIACLRTGRAWRVPRARVRGRGKSFVSNEILISERPAEAEDRAVPGRWEGELIIGLESSANGTLVERLSPFTMLLHLRRMDGHDGPRVKNGPALAGHGTLAVRDAIAEAITTLPEQLRQSLTWDQGAEMAEHAQLRIDTGLPVSKTVPRTKLLIPKRIRRLDNDCFSLSNRSARLMLRRVENRSLSPRRVVRRDS